MKQIKIFLDDMSLLAPVNEVLGELGLEGSDKTVHIEKGNELSISGTDTDIVITYSEKHQLFRALSYLPAFLENGKEISEKFVYENLCYMAECSRNAVMTVDTAKQLIRYLALMGYSSMMLYTEETYEIEGYGYFGYQRGRYTKEELREIDDYAYSFGIELIPCIQTLGHLERTLQFSAYQHLRDLGGVLLVGEERVYDLIRAMFKTVSECFRSKRIHIGMDEAWGLGTGKYLIKNGYHTSTDIMKQHLSRVLELCREYGYSPMMWSDMFFREQFGGEYFVKEGEMSQDIIDKVPTDVALVYWDYYTLDKNGVEHMMKLHRQFRNKIVFAGGAWKWTGLASRNEFSLFSTKLQLDECEKAGVTDIIATGWGDNGAEASQFSILPSLMYYAERAYGHSGDRDELAVRAEQCFGTSLETLMAFDIPDNLPETRVGVSDGVKNPSKYLLFNDVLAGLMDLHMNKENVASEYAKNAEQLFEFAKDEKFGYALSSSAWLCKVLSRKSDLGVRLREAYKSGDREKLRGIADEIPLVVSDLNEFLKAFRNQWYCENKTFGFETQEIRIGGLRERLNSARDRILDYLEGKVSEIEELESEILGFYNTQEGKYIYANEWNLNVTSGIL